MVKNIKLSHFIMGGTQILCRQYIKGLLFLFAQIAFVIFMLFFGINSLMNFVTLGTKTQSYEYDETLGFDRIVEGDNSMLCLIFGVMTLMIIVLFLVVYRANIKSAALAEYEYKVNCKIVPFRAELQSLLDRNFHKTMLFIPVVGILLFTVLPLIFMILVAFTNYDKAHQPPGNLFDWVGLQNFKNMLGENELLSGTFFPVLIWTLTWAIISTISCYIFGILTALLINQKGVRLKKMWRTILILTIAIPQFISLLIMRNMLNRFGPINEALLSLNLINEPLPFLTDPIFAKITVLVVNLWVGIPYTMLLTTGILMNIPKDLFEAASLDGANAIQRFFKITLPHIWHVTAPFVITQFIGNINNFNVIYLLSEGGPMTTDYYVAGKTDLLVTWLYKLTADEKDYNLASTIGILVFIISIIISLVTYRNTSSYKDEEQFG